MASKYPVTAIDEQNWLIEVVKIINSVFNPRKSFFASTNRCHKVPLAGVKYTKLSILGHQAHVCNKHKLYFGTKTVPQSFLGRCVPAPPLDSPLTALLAGKVFCQGGGSTLCHSVYIHCIRLQLFAIVTSSCSLAGFSLVILELYDQGMVVFCLCYMIKMPSIWNTSWE